MKTVLDIPEAEFQQTVLENPLPVAVLFYASDCPICISVLPVLEYMAQEYEGQMVFVKVNKDFHRNLSKKYHARASSSIIFFQNGKEFCRRLSGYVRRPELKCIIQEVIQRKCECMDRDKTECDILILGGGPSGLTAALYAARAKLYTVVVDDSFIGGQVATTYHVANYPGTNGVIRGIDLVDNMKKQALDFGAQMDDMQDIVKLSLDGEIKHLQTAKTDYYTRSVIIATGATPRKLNIEGEDAFTGRGVHYCATCDAALYQDAHVIVVGGGEAASEEAVFLTRFAKKVTVVHRGGALTSTKSAQDEVFKNPSIEVSFHTQLIAIHGDQFVTEVTLENNQTGETWNMPIDGVFIYIGMQPQSKWFEGQIALDENGYIQTDAAMRTSLEGVFAAGDVRKKEVRQITTAVSDGTVAAIMVERFINVKEISEKEINNRKSSG